MRPTVCGDVELNTADVAFVHCEEAGVKNGIVRVYVEGWNDQGKYFLGYMVVSGKTEEVVPVRFCRGQVVDVFKRNWNKDDLKKFKEDDHGTK